MQINNELIKAYVDDVTTLINEMDGILKKRNSVGTLDNESVDALFRIFHTIKASAIVLNDSKTVDISYKMENVMSYLRKHGADSLSPESVINLMFRSEYFFRSRLNLLIRDASDNYISEFEGDLDTLVNEIDFKDSAPINQMVSFDAFRVPFENIVKEMSEDLGKKARIDFVGNTLYIDRHIITRLSGPLTQIIRNAMDHGIELPSRRIEKGKPETGIIIVTYGIENGTMFITIFNDGETLNLKNILRHADNLHILKKARELYKPFEVATLIMEKGFTTKDKPNKYSGRGVGMDIIKSTAKDMGGSVIINSGVTDGFSITLTFPIDENSQIAAIKEQTKGGEKNAT